MTGFKTYARAHLRAGLRTLLYLLVIAFAITLVFALAMQPTNRYLGNGTYATSYNSTLHLPVVVLGILAYVLPVTEFSFFKKRINLNVAYALPVDRRAIGVAHYLTGAATLITVFTLSYLTNLVLLLSRGPGWFHFTPMLAHYALCVLIGLALYSMNVFVFCEANTVGDGIWFVLLWTYLPAIVTFAAEQVISSFVQRTMGSFPWGLLVDLTDEYRHLVEARYVDYTPSQQVPELTVWCIVWGLIGAAATVAFLRTFGKRRMEKTEEPSDSFLGYRMLIPAFAVFGMIGFPDPIFWIIIEILAVLGYTIYRRGFHYKVRDIVILLSLVVFLFLP